MFSEETLSRYFEFRGALEAVRVLRREIGFAHLVPLLVRLEAHHLRGEPFKKFPEPSCEKERLSRRQVGQAILLYQLLKGRYGQEQALAIARKVVKASAIEFLSHLLPPLRRTDYETASHAERDLEGQKLAHRVVNAEADVAVVGMERVDFTVKKCWFVELTRAAGVPEMAGLFCAGDEGYFETRQPEIRYERTTTLAQGGPCCDMKLHWIEPASSRPAAEGRI
ncbi:MAG: L-2-amino-thiazoline-4-carboxylic acid hydrolase [Bdellovibrionota bacterium]